MLSSSQSESDENINQFREAVDKNFLSDEMYIKVEIGTLNPRARGYQSISVASSKNGGVTKSQRHLDESKSEIGVENHISEKKKQYFVKKFTKLLETHIEFFESKQLNVHSLLKVPESGLVLLNGADNYIKPYEDIESDSRTLNRRLPIKRRRLRGEIVPRKMEKVKAASISVEHILNGYETKLWTVKKERRDRVLHYNLQEKRNNSYICHSNNQV